MANTTENVISQLKKKTAIGFSSPLPIGTSARYVTGIRGTHVNNIEENFLLGYDLITTIEDEPENGRVHILKEFRDAQTTTDYYFMDIYEYNNYSDYKRWFANNTLFVAANDVDFGSDHDFLMNDPSIYTVDDETLLMQNPENPEEAVIYVAILYYKTGNESIPVSKLIRYSAQKEDNKIIQRQVVQSLL